MGSVKCPQAKPLVGILPGTQQNAAFRGFSGLSDSFTRSQYLGEQNARTAMLALSRRTPKSSPGQAKCDLPEK